jgi:hypothetical protein
MTSPGIWTDMGPSSATARPGSYRTMGGSIVTARKAPSLGIQTPGERARMHRAHAKLCGHPMKIAGGPCARLVGHAEFAGGSHMTATTLALKAERMRKP